MSLLKKVTVKNKELRVVYYIESFFKKTVFSHSFFSSLLVTFLSSSFDNFAEMPNPLFHHR